MTDTTKPGRGRPEGRAYSKPKHLRLLPEDETDLAYLRQRWRTSDSEVLRRALREAAERERLEATAGAE